MFNRNFIILFISQIFSSAPPAITILLSGIIGSSLIEIKYLATLPTGIMVGGIAVSSVFASNIMAHKGRRFGFCLGSIVGTLAALCCAYSVYIENFNLYCFSNFFIGFAMAFTHQYRFAAAEVVVKELIPRAISFVLLSSIAGALFGVNLVNLTKNFISSHLYVGSYLSLSVITIIPYFLFLFYKNDNFTSKEKIKSESTITKLLTNKHIQQAITSAGVGYITMSFLMTATPISMHILDGISIYNTGIVIQLHVMGMFIPSLFTGDLIKKFGHNKIIVSGVLLLFLSILINIFFQTYIGFAIGLILLGIGWNFLFLCSSALLVVSYKIDDKYVAQGSADFIIFATQATGSLSAGILLYTTSWQFLNVMCIPLLIVVLYFVYFTNKKEKQIVT